MVQDDYGIFLNSQQCRILKLDMILKLESPFVKLDNSDISNIIHILIDKGKRKMSGTSSFLR